MLNHKFKFALALIITIVLTLGFSISFQNLLAATWQEPTTAPPNSNIFPPVYNEYISDPASQVLINNKPVGITNGLLITGGNLIVNTGNVGIGVTTPADKLSVTGTIRATDVCITSGNCLSTVSGGGQWITNGNNISNNNTGNVGIGTTNPSAPLTISSGNQPDLLIEARGGGSAAQIRFQNINRWWEVGADSAPDLFYIGVQSGTAEDSKLVITPAGNVGIGTPNPAVKLDVAGDGRFGADHQITIGHGVAPANNSIMSDDNNSLYINSGLNASLFFYTNGAYRMVIHPSGNVGIGTGVAAPSNRLTVGANNAFGISDAGDILVNGGGDNSWALYDSQGAPALQTIIGWDFALDHLGLAGNSDAAYSVRARGSFYADSGGIGSDIRMKKNIVTLDSPLETIEKLRGVKFEWKDGIMPERKNRSDIGFIAQEVEKVIPEIVWTDSKGYKALEYGNITALLVEGMKEQQRQIDELKKEIEILKK
jgi:trimeric autotransporter adhesin